MGGGVIILHRTFAWLLVLAIAVDQVCRVILGGPFYIVGLGSLPSANQTISGWVGRSANKGREWAIVAQDIIDGLFYEGHCQHAILTDGKH